MSQFSTEDKSVWTRKILTMQTDVVTGKIVNNALADVNRKNRQ